MEIAPRHFGNREQPQNLEPGLSPRVAVRLTIVALQAGQEGVIFCSGFPLSGFRFRWVWILDFAVWIILFNSSAPTKAMSLLCAKDSASRVKLPDVTTTPPFAPCEAITPNNSRTTITVTLADFQCLHCTKMRSPSFVSTRSIPPSAPSPVSTTA